MCARRTPGEQISQRQVQISQQEVQISQISSTNQSMTSNIEQPTSEPAEQISQREVQISQISSTPSDIEQPTDAGDAPPPKRQPASEPAEHKFVARTLIMGRPEEATSLQDALGLGRKQFAEGYAKGELAIIDEFEGPAARDEDKANLHYVLKCKAVASSYPPHVLMQIEQGRYHGGKLEPGDFDRGHDGMRLDDFVDLANDRMGARLLCYNHTPTSCLPQLCPMAVTPSQTQPELCQWRLCKFHEW